MKITAEGIAKSSVMFFKILGWILSGPGEEDLIDNKKRLILIGSKIIAGMVAWIGAAKFCGVMLLLLSLLLLLL